MEAWKSIERACTTISAATVAKMRNCVFLIVSNLKIEPEKKFASWHMDPYACTDFQDLRERQIMSNREADYQLVPVHEVPTRRFFRFSSSLSIEPLSILGSSRDR